MIYKKGCRVLCERVPIRYAWIKKHKGDFSTAIMCKFMKVSRSGYYEWLTTAKCNRDKEDNDLTYKIKAIFQEGRRNYGSRPIKKKLSRHGIIVSRKRIARLMNEADLRYKTKHKFKATTDSSHNKQVAPNLLDRKFKVSAANCYWVGDITYVATEEGWLYLATVIDLFSRKVIGWSMNSNMKAELVRPPKIYKPYR